MTSGTPPFGGGGLPSGDGLPPPSPAYQRIPQMQAAWLNPSAQAGPPLAPLAWQQVPRSVEPQSNSLVRAFLLERIRRFDPRGVHPVGLLLGVVCFLAWILAANFILSPGVLQSFSQGSQPDLLNIGHVWTTFAFVVPLVCSTIGSTVLLLCQGPLLRSAALAVPVIASFAIVVSISGSARLAATWPWLLGEVVIGMVALGLAVTALCVRRGRLWFGVGVGLVLALQWVLLWVCITHNHATATFTSLWTVYGFGISSIVAFAVICGAAEWAQRAHASTKNLAIRLHIARWVPFVAAVVVLGFLAARFTIWRDLFGALDGALWISPSPWQWVHSFVIAFVVVGLVVWSERRPFKDKGRGVVVAMLAVAAAPSFVLFVVIFLTSILAPSAPTPQLDQISVWLDEHTNEVALGVLVAMVLCLVPPLFRSTSMVGALVALVSMLPLHLTITLRSDLPVVSPLQALPCIAILVALLSLANLIARRDLVDRGLLFRLAVVPTLAVHAGQILPAAFGDDLEVWVLVAVSLLAMVLLGPRRRVGREGATTAFLLPFVAQAALLSFSIVGIAVGSENDILTTVAALYLALPVATILCCNLEPKRPKFMSSGPATPMFVPPAPLPMRTTVGMQPR